jgi:uncharacterized protein (DUF433 family)
MASVILDNLAAGESLEAIAVDYQLRTDDVRGAFLRG